jgi:site-specific DNA-methyltransferase (adenine-specific)
MSNELLSCVFMNTETLFSSKSNEWETPQEFFDRLNQEFNFTLDAAATDENAKCPRYFTFNENGLAQSWQGETVWLNPPYGRAVGEWIAKARAEADKNGATVVCLIPARTDTRYFHEHCFKGEVRFVRGRLKFGGSKNSAPFPSAVVIFRPSSSPEAR